MISPLQFIRLLAIQRVLIRHRLDEIAFAAAPPLRPLRFLFYLLPFFWFRGDANASEGQRIRLALEDLGPVFIKLGQMFSTRRDLLPDEIADELAKLQDAVPPFPGAEARKIVEHALKQPILEAFERFDEEPLASASIAQVHTARTKATREKPAEEVVVKVVRPDIEPRIRHDMKLAKRLAVLAERYFSEARRLHLTRVVNDYERVLLDELNMMREAANLSQLRHNFSSGDVELVLPTLNWELTRDRILVMGRVDGVPAADAETLRQQGVDLKKLSALGVEIFFTQVFRDNFFHADMHPGNVFIEAKNPRHPRYMAVDFGVMGSLTEEDQRYLAENLLAFFNRNYRQVAQLHIDSGWISAEVRIDELEAAFRTVCEPIFERPFRELSFAMFLLRLFRAGRRFGMEVQPQLVLLQKTLLYIEGLGKQLDPDLDLWATAKPFLEKWIKQHRGFQGLKTQIEKHGPELFVQLPEMPGLAFSLMKLIRKGELPPQARNLQTEEIRQAVQENARSTHTAIAGGSLLISGTVLVQFGMLAVGGGMAAAGLVVLLRSWSH